MNKMIIFLLSMVGGALVAQTYYETVGVDPSSTPEQIRAKCRQKMLNKETDVEPEEVHNACEVLKDNAKRRHYDISLKQGRPASGDNRGSTLTIEAPAFEELPQNRLESMKKKVR